MVHKPPNCRSIAVDTIINVIKNALLKNDKVAQKSVVSSCYEAGEVVFSDLTLTLAVLWASHLRLCTMACFSSSNCAKRSSETILKHSDTTM